MGSYLLVIVQPQTSVNLAEIVFPNNTGVCNNGVVMDTSTSGYSTTLAGNIFLSLYDAKLIYILTSHIVGQSILSLL